jgi:hypothetical protein
MTVASTGLAASVQARLVQHAKALGIFSQSGSY